MYIALWPPLLITDGRLNKVHAHRVFLVLGSDDEIYRILIHKYT